MPWISRINSVSDKDLVEQLMAIVQRDQRAALDSVDAQLASFVGYYFSESAIKQFPALMLRAPRVSFDLDAEVFRKGTRAMACGVAVQHQDPEAAIRTLYDVVEAMDRLFSSIDLADFHTALQLTHPSFTGGLKNLAGIAADVLVGDLRVTGHDTSASARTPDGFAVAGTISLELDIAEGTSA